MTSRKQKTKIEPITVVKMNIPYQGKDSCQLRSSLVPM